MDIAPTVLHLMRVPVPEETDGQVLLNLFSEDAEPRRRSVVTQRAHTHLLPAESYSPDEITQIEAQLRGLGYMG